MDDELIASGSLAVSVNTLCRTSAEDMVSNTCVAYPNPTTGRTTISFTSEEKSKFTLHVTDLLGNVLVSEVVNAEAGLNQQEMNFASIAKGVYLITLLSDKRTFSTRLIVE